MNELADDEALVYFIVGFASLPIALIYYDRIARPAPFARRLPHRLALVLTPPACLALLPPVLLRHAARQVREDARYVGLFSLAAPPLLLVVAKVAELLGVSLRDDAVERRNSAAVVTLCAAWLGATAVYAGANVGEGDSIWMTFGPALLGLSAWAALWFAVELLTTLSDAIAIDRDVPSAVRLAAYLILSGVILGWSVAGDYVSLGDTLADFARRAWPAPIAAVLLVIAHRARYKPARLPA